MKTMMIALVAWTLAQQAAASHNHPAGCPANCPQRYLTVAPASTATYDQKVAAIVLKGENEKSLLQYNQTMQNTLLLIAQDKQRQVLENLEAAQRYHQLMGNMLQQMTQHQMDDRLDDAAAAQRYETLMAGMLAKAQD